MKSVVRAFVFNKNGEILMARHTPDALWVLPGGHVETDERLHAAMIRELQEEFGLGARFFDIDQSEILHHQGKKLTHHPLPLAIYELSYTDKNGRDKSRVEHVFLMETDDDVHEKQESEIHEYAWMDAEDILSMKPNVETWDFIIEMLDRIMGSDDEV